MRATKAWKSLLESMNHLWTLLVDSLMTIGAFVIVGLTVLVVHKSVERLQLWGVPSLLIDGMEILHAFIWAIDALAVLWLCGVAAIKLPQESNWR